MLTIEEREKLLERAMARHRYAGDALIEVLHVAQYLNGYLSKPILKHIARSLRLPSSRVLGVATFYHLFRFEPDKKHSGVVCLGTACYVAGGPALMQTLRTRAAQDARDAGHDEWTIRAGRCVGSCGLAPVVICDGMPLSRVTPAQLDAHLTRMVDP